MEIITFHTAVEIFTASGNTESNFNTADFINAGTSNVSINSIPITPGNSWSSVGNNGEIDKTNQYRIVFSGTGTNKLVIAKKIYNGI